MADIKSQLLPQYYFGYTKDPVDPRDYKLETFHQPSKFTPLMSAMSETEKVEQEEQKQNKKFSQLLNEKFDINEFNASELPLKYDIMKMLTTIRNQLNLGSCVPSSGSCPVEYITKVINNSNIQMSILYGYKKMRDLMKVTGDTGGYLRTFMRSLARYGWVPEKEYPYIVKDFDNPISTELKEQGNFYKAVRYLRVDHRDIRKDRQQVLIDLKKWSYYEVPIIFGFIVYDSCLIQSNSPNNTLKGKIPFPDSASLQNENPAGGHAVTIVGYDDDMLITNFSKDRTRVLSRTRGAFIIRNSWGTGWGNVLSSTDNKTYQGYGYLPYEYVIQNMANDFWILLSQQFLDEKVFEE